MAARGVRHFVAIVAVAAIGAYVAIYARGWADAPIRSDGYSYYVYLPSVFIYHDVSLDTLSQDWYGGAFPDFSAVRRWPSTGRWLDAVPIGVAVMMLPFFLAADALTWWSNLPRDGFSFYYQHGAGLAGLCYLLGGLALTRTVLRRHFSDGVVLAALVTVTWGTNLFHYGTFDATFSHAFSFCLIAAWLAAVDRWWERPRAARSAGLGALAAMIVLARNVNGVFLLLLPLYGVTRPRDLRDRAHALWARRSLLATAAAAGCACVSVQAAYYRFTTGSWWVNSYSLLNNRFNFATPRIGSVLFSTQKGLFFWSPALLLAVAGAVLARGWTRKIVVPAVAIFALQLYIIASWNDWQLGGSFGHRGFTDGLALAAPLVAATYEWAWGRTRVRVAVALFACVAVCLSVVQMAQYWLGVLPFANTTWAQYRALFLKFP